MPRTLTLLVVAAVTGTTLAAAPTVTAATSADAVRTGFRIPTDGTAGGSWVGSRSTGGRTVYRTDPGRTKIVTSGFGAAVWRTRLTGAGPHIVTARDTSRAAWILAKYGTYPYNVQNAAVEIAVDHLLYGGSWALGGSRTASRLAGVPEAAKVRAFASTMLADSTTYAGPYRATVTAGGTTVGGQVPVTVTVTVIASGVGVPLLPVTVVGPGGTRSLTTGQNGRASTAFTAANPGTVAVTATVGKVPEARLLVRAPSTTGASRVAVAGLKSTLVATTTAAVTARPTLRVSTGASQILAGSRTRPQLVVSGLPAGYRGTASLQLFGPAPERSGLTCTAPLTTQTITVTTDATYTGTDVRLGTPGYYGWSVRLPGSSTSTPASSGCAPDGAVVRVTQW